MKDLSEILGDIKKRVNDACARAGRDPSEVEIIAVTKTHGPETVKEAWENNLTIVGENKVQEACWKRPLSPMGPQWHMIGHLQSNKVRHALELFDFIHSVDSAKLADRINLISEESGARPHILLEVNVSGEKSKSGMRPEDVKGVIEHILQECPRITVEGLMTMAPFSENPEDARPYFRNLRLLRDKLQDELSISLPRLSMGMSGDFEVAVEEGATWLRLGSILFGERPKARSVRRIDSDFGADCSTSGLDSYSGEGPTFKVLE
jgi:pyridoxal phosphate enzyme (YggS family)